MFVNCQRQSFKPLDPQARSVTTTGPTDHVVMRILQTIVSEIPDVLGLTTRMQGV